MLPSIWKPAERSRDPQQRALIYLICGNPGLISFYVDFLDALRSLLDTSWQGHTQTAYDIYGRNLAGFSDDDHEPFGPDNPPLDTDGQVEAMYRDVASRRTSAGKPYDFVILMGHSIGAYICVEIFHRHALHARSEVSSHPYPHLHLRHAFLLFPTIASLAVSQAGARLNYIINLPTMETYLFLYVKALFWLFPQCVLRWVVAYVMGFSPRIAGIMAEWLKSRDGLRQALHMAKSELDTIHEDKWEEELWEASVALTSPASSSSSSSSSSPPHPPDAVLATPSSVPRFFMFYGKKDHWVADHVRDEFVERRRRAGEKAGTSIIVDEGNIPHAFCAKEDTSWMIARKVHAWVMQIDKAAAKAS
ncbi:hypothetical protein E4U21_006937 [Claviceps maximensis]|nr:hypothetical protein E4U21_006937 [Claviceps maximensis]